MGFLKEKNVYNSTGLLTSLRRGCVERRMIMQVVEKCHVFMEQKELLCSQERTVIRNYRPYTGNCIVA